MSLFWAKITMSNIFTSVAISSFVNFKLFCNNNSEYDPTFNEFWSHGIYDMSSCHLVKSP